MVLLVLPGGRSRGRSLASRRDPAYLRMAVMARTLRRRLASDGVAVALLRYRLRGWNGDRADPVHDTRWALEALRSRFPSVPVILVGHSMGARAALWVADHPSVAAVCALAPWTPAGDPVRQLAKRAVLIVHGLGDRRTAPEASRMYAARAMAAGHDIHRIELARQGHAMLRGHRAWDKIVLEFATGQLPAKPRLGSAPE
ncbi:alpha/beta fold hydrolase [Yinghuangia sp. YIM S09857]|uniref:alpha/beta fold hydrolase n=1 Tax=Yinghuangia sp. YIM S09857 TaxID=3436929 RepID=UPI003F5397F8